MKLFIYSVCILLVACNTKSADEEEGGDADSSAQNVVHESGMGSFLPGQDDIGYSESNDSYCDVRFGAYLYDPGEEFTNIRSTPNGKILMALPWGEIEEEYLVSIIASEGEWFKIESPILGAAHDYIIQEEYAWIHNSVLAVDTRNYANQVIEVHEEPNQTSKVLSKIEHESGGLRPLKACGEWVYISVELDGVTHKGWVNVEWICGNPLTNCS